MANTDQMSKQGLLQVTAPASPKAHEKRRDSCTDQTIQEDLETMMAQMKAGLNQEVTRLKPRDCQIEGYTESERERQTARLQRLRATQPYTVTRSLLHGQGIFGRCTINPGTILMCERALVERPYKLLAGNNTTPAFDKYFTDIRHMRTCDKEEVIFIMSGNKSAYEVFTDFEQLDETLKARVKPRNMTAVQLASTFRQHGYPFVGKVPTHCLFSGDVHLLNHSCTPNAEASWDPNTRRMTVKSTKPIGDAEEITISYIDPCQERSRRQTCLGFLCACAECTLTGHEKTASDSRRRLLESLLKQLRDFKTAVFGSSEETAVVTHSAIMDITEYGGLECGDVLDLTEQAREVVGCNALDYSELALLDEIEYVIYRAQYMVVSWMLEEDSSRLEWTTDDVEWLAEFFDVEQADRRLQADLAWKAFDSKFAEISRLTKCIGATPNTPVGRTLVEALLALREVNSPHVQEAMEMLPELLELSGEVTLRDT
ncbi:hypothetical protein LTR08_002853 [Meristemomyces frigidus]|nr:hypothetical protein LTR08_002853 [Meristemomyces frigidus]